MQHWIEWEEDVTSTGIQLQGTTKVKKRGILVSATPMIVGPGNITIFVCARVGNEMVVFSAPIKFVDGPHE